MNSREVWRRGGRILAALVIFCATGGLAAEVRLMLPSSDALPFGGIGFQNAEANLVPLMSDAFRDERVLKSFREISPTFARVYAGFADCPKSQADRFADYYDATFRRAGTELYVVPGVMPFVPEAETEAYAEKVAAGLAYLVHERGCSLIRKYCLTNELGVNGRGDWYVRHMDRFRDLFAAVRRALDRHGLSSVELVATDVNNHVDFSLQQLDWATRRMDDLLGAYCTHWYMFLGRRRDGVVIAPSSPENAATIENHFTRLVAKAAEKGKRYFVGEIGLWTPPVSGGNVMFDDTGYPLRAPEAANEGALTLAEIALGAMNAGAYGALSWSFVDYPDPFIVEDGNSPEARATYEAARCVYWPDLKYNKWGLFRWDSVERDYSSYPSLYTMGHLARLFRRGARVMRAESDDRELRVGAVTNPDGSMSVVLVNWGGAKTIRVRSAHPIAKPLRVYEYDSAKPPMNAFNDLQPAKGTVAAEGGVFSVAVPARSMTFLTTDYVDRTPPRVSGVRREGRCVRWDVSSDPDLSYYRVYRDGRQVASTVATKLEVRADGGEYSVRGVDRWGNEGK